MHIYPYKTKEFIKEGRESLNRMYSAKNGEELRRALVSFLNATRFCTQILLADYKNELVGFNDWWNKKYIFLNEDPLCKFFVKTRNAVIKKGEDVIEINWIIKGPGVMKGPLQIGPDGTVYTAIVKNDSFEWVPRKNVKGHKIISWDFNNKPPTCVNKKANILCNEYLELLDSLVNEFINKFGSLN